MRLIDADKLHFRCSYDGDCYCNTKEECAKCNDYILYKEDIDNAPTVEPKHGEWKLNRKVNLHTYTCSECSNSYLMDVFFNFCPNCGADMRKGGVLDDNEIN